MNKLYKYIPFDISGVVNDSVPLKLIGIKGNQLIVTPENYKGSGGIGYCDINKFKPILRPFSDLTKELPLTKTAAEMIGMKEEELIFIAVICLSIVSEYSIQEIDDIGTEIWQNDNDVVFSLYLGGGDSFDYTLSISFNYHLKNEITLHYDCDEIPLQKVEKMLDFLRAMHFNLDFEEGEYIKLEN